MNTAWFNLTKNTEISIHVLFVELEQPIIHLLLTIVIYLKKRNWFQMKTTMRTEKNQLKPFLKQRQ
jgi:hypothetical protein